MIEDAAGALPGSITVPKMGAVLIADMADWIIARCETRETGLRSTEKLHEDLVHPCEPAFERRANTFVLHSDGNMGYTYTSDTASRIAREQFLAMLAESEASNMTVRVHLAPGASQCRPTTAWVKSSAP